MHALNLYMLTRAAGVGHYTKFENLLSGRAEPQKVREHEFLNLASLIELLTGKGVSVRDLDGFYYGYSIEQIGKEFDLLKIDPDRKALNIELKSRAVPAEKIEKQLIKNRYYLGPVAPRLYLFTYVEEGGLFYRLKDDRLERCGIRELVRVLKGFRKYGTGDIDELFRARDYLVSPLNEPGRFLDRRYFLTQQQESIKKELTDGIRGRKRPGQRDGAGNPECRADGPARISLPAGINRGGAGSAGKEYRTLAGAAGKEEMILSGSAGQEGSALAEAVGKKERNLGIAAGKEDRASGAAAGPKGSGKAADGALSGGSGIKAGTPDRSGDSATKDGRDIQDSITCESCEKTDIPATCMSGVKNETDRYGLHLHTGNAFYAGITGDAGTGKTLLLYDLAVACSGSGEERCCIIHVGRLCEGHMKLMAGLPEIDILEGCMLSGEELAGYSCFFVDEAQRMGESDLSEVVMAAEKCGGSCIFSYDRFQTLSKTEQRMDIPGKLKALPGYRECSLSGRIRSNREIGAFIRTLLDLRSTALYGQDTGSSEVLYAGNEDEAAKIIRFYCRELDFIYIASGHSERDAEFMRHCRRGYFTEDVIGQEFDSVLMVLDDRFRYDDEGRLRGHGHANPDYIYERLFFQAVSRTRERLCVVVLGNEEVFGRLLEVKCWRMMV